MDRNKVKLLFLGLFIVISTSLKAQETTTKQYYNSNLKFALPADSKVKINWVCAPIEDSVVNKGSLYDVCFGVDLYNQPWIGFHGEDIINPVKQYQFIVSPKYQNFTFLENGAFLVATDNDLGFVVAPAYRKPDYNNRVRVGVQPIAALPLSQCKIYPGVGNCLFLTGKNEAIDKYDIYLLTPEKSSTGTSIRQYKKIFTGPYEYCGIAGDSINVYIATSGLLIKLNTKDNSITKIPVNRMDGYFKGLAYSDQAGLYYCTDIGVGFIGANSNIPFLSCPSPKIFLRGNTIYVLCSNTLGVLSFSNIGDLKRYDRPVEVLPALATDEVKPAMIRFFEGPNPAPPIPDRKYATTFGKDTTRFIYGEVTLNNLLYQKQPNKQVVDMTLRKTYTDLVEYQKVNFDFGLNYAALIGWFQFGSGTLDTFYPGDYTVTTKLNNIQIDERKFTITGKVTMFEAAAHGDTLKLRELIRSGADVDYKNIYGTTTLMQVAINGDMESTKMLIDRGADVNARNSSGQSPLITACMRFRNNDAIVKLLLDHKADPNAADKDGETPLIEALTNYATSPAMVKLLIDAGANVNVKDAKGRTPLTCISLWSDKQLSGQLLEMLLKKGVDPNTRQEDGTSLAFAALGATNYGYLKTLISNGSNPNVTGKDMFIDFREHTLLGELLLKFGSSSEVSDKQDILDIIELVCNKGGKLNTEEELTLQYGNKWKILPNSMIYDILERQDELVKIFIPGDPTLQQLIVKRLMGMAYNEIVRASSVSDYRTALDLCNLAKDRADLFHLTSEIPEVYFDLGLLSINLGYTSNAGIYLKSYLEVAPDGQLVSKAKSLLRKLD